MQIRLLRSSDVYAMARHLERHTAESGHAGDLVFAPFTDFDRERYEETRRDSWRRAVDEPGWERAWGAFEDDRIVGHVDLTQEGQLSDMHRVRLGTGVERNFRGRGMGSALLEHAIRWARQEPLIEWIDLYVFAHNGGAQRLYARFGFEQRGWVVDRYRVAGQSVDDVHMVRRVSTGP